MARSKIAPARGRLPAKRLHEAGGAYGSLDALLGLRFAARELRFVPRRRALRMLAGQRASNFRGRGIEFEEVRRYQAGDELRAIDWRVTARTGHPHTRLYREERERPLMLMLDQRQSMFFGSRVRFKSVQALHCAALLAWAALQGGDRVGGLVLGREGHAEVRPRRSRRAVLGLLEHGLEANQALRAHSPDASTLSIADALQDLRRIARPGTALFLISDFHDWDAAAAEQLLLLARHCELTAIRIVDRLERLAPPPGHYRVSDGRQSVLLDSADPALRRRFETRAAETAARLLQDFGGMGCPLIELDSEESALQVLARFYGRPRGARVA